MDTAEWTQKKEKDIRDQYLSNTSLSVATFKGVSYPSIETEDLNVSQEDFPEAQEVSSSTTSSQGPKGKFFK